MEKSMIIKKLKTSCRPGIAGLIVLLALSLSGCPHEPDEEEKKTPPPVIALADGRGELELTLADGEEKFFDLATGKEIANSRSQDWDISFYATRQIRTNSGVTTREHRGRGQGAVWHTEKTDFEAAVLADAVKDDPVYAAYNEDVLRYAVGMAGTNSQPDRFMNVMTYLGYPNEDKNPSEDGTTQAKIFQPFYLYNKRAFYEATVGTMPPDFRVTNRVYIIRHGDGAHHSKFQVTKFVRNHDNDLLGPGSDTYKVIWENF
jgi:hypothetical protein